MMVIKHKHKQVAQLCQRNSATHVGDFKGWIILRLNFRLKCYVSRQYLWTVR